MTNKWKSKIFNFFDFYVDVSKSILKSTSSIEFRSFDSFWNFDVIWIVSIKIYKTFHYCFVKLVFCQSNMIKMLRVLSSSKILTILLIVTLRLNTFFEINDVMTNELTIDELLKTRDKRTWNRFEMMILLDDELSSKIDKIIDFETKFW